MRESLFRLPLPADRAESAPALIVEGRSRECALVNSTPHALEPYLVPVAELLRANGFSLVWILYALPGSSYACGRWLQRRFVGARIATGALSAASRAIGRGNGEPDRLFDEGECLPLGCAFGRVRHLEAAARVATGYVFPGVGCVGTAGNLLRPLRPDPLELL